MYIITGVFLYVALVDMMPELSSGHTHPLSEEHQTEGHIVSVILQVSITTVNKEVVICI